MTVCNAMKARIAYDGPLLSSGQMDVKELAPSLIAFADLVDYANTVLGGQDKIKVMLNQDSIKAGSFDITMVLDCDILRQAQVLVGIASSNGLADLMTVLGWGATVGGCSCGVFSLIKKINGRSLTDINVNENKKAEISLADGEKVITDEKVLKVFLDVNCRMSIEKIVMPVKEDGIDSFELRKPLYPEDKEPIEKIEKDDVHAFVAPPSAVIPDEALPPNDPPEYEMTVKISAVNFEKGKKWRLTDGNNTFWASIVDESFLQKVDKGELSFTSGDMLKIKYKVKQSIKSGNLTSDYIVVQVLDLKKRPEQIKLDFKYESN